MFCPLRLLFCTCLLFVAVASAAAAGLPEEAKENDGATARSNVQHASNVLKRMAIAEPDEDYSPSANTDTVLSAPPPPVASRKLLQDYSPMANKRNSPSPRRRLLQHSTSHGLSFQIKELFPDYDAAANQRSSSSVSSRRRLLHNYSPLAVDRSPSINNRRRLLQDYSPVANDKTPTNK